jgi:hypothetical protein
MFNEDGSWKEFSLIQNEKYTPFPLWLFCIVWAIVSYGVVKVFSSSVKEEIKESPILETPIKRRNVPSNLKKGVYVLNREASEIEGVPRYVYVGEESSD